ncbi:MAG: AAA family ATPase [Candidatus Eremiobacteraeota bacterium]|nr:AAA family ATPase [Candidatus Eremiobacteraeota bacterium]
MIVRLQRVALENFLTWETLDWVPREGLNCLVGANDSGKSNLLRAFEFVALLAQRPLDGVFTEEKPFLAWVTAGRRPKVRISFEGSHKFEEEELPFQYSVTIVQPISGIAARVEQETLSVGGHSLVLDGRNLRRRFAAEPDWTWEGFPRHVTLAYVLLNTNSVDHEQAEQIVRDPLRRLASDLSHFLRLQLVAAAIREACPLKLSQSNLEPSGKNLAHGIARLVQNPESRTIFESIRQAVGELIPGVKDLGTRTLSDASGVDKIVLRFGAAMDGKTYYFDADSASDGILYLTALVALSQFPNTSGLTLLEEPEIGLHPKLVESAMKLLAHYVQRTQQQVFLTTHSPIVLNELEPENVWVVTRDQGNISRIFPMAEFSELDRWRDNFGSGEIWQTLGESTLTGA